MNVFEAAEENSLTARQTAESCRITINSNSMAVCPFHKDKDLKHEDRREALQRVLSTHIKKFYFYKPICNTKRNIMSIYFLMFYRGLVLFYYFSFEFPRRNYLNL